MEKEEIKIGDIVYILESGKNFLDAINGIVISISHSDLNDSDLFVICDKNGNKYSIYYPRSNSHQHLVTREEYLKRISERKQTIDEMQAYLQRTSDRIREVYAEQGELCARSHHIDGNWERVSPDDRGI